MRHDLARREAGVGLIEVLVAMLIFSIGLLALAAIYVRTAPAPLQDSDVMAVQAAADGCMSALAVNPSALPVNVTAATNASSFPTPALAQWFTAASPGLPGFTVSIHSTPDAVGNPCSSTSCGITLTISWTQMGDQRSQVFYDQVGIH